MDTEVRMRVGAKGSLLIPASFLKMLGVKAGEVLVLRIDDGELRMTTVQRRIELAQRTVRKYVKPGISLADELIAERRAEATRDQE